MKPYIEMVEQPAPKSLRFRYESERRPSGNLIGVHSTKDCPTFPKIHIYGLKDDTPACLIISCVTKDTPYRNHPYSVVNSESEMNTEWTNRGIIRMALYPQAEQHYHEVEFKDLKVQCVKKTEIRNALKHRKDIDVDPFGNSALEPPDTKDFSALRLCFQVFVKIENRLIIKSDPTVSDIIYDKKTMGPIKIRHVTPNKASVRGGTNVTIICDRVVKDQVDIRFFQVHEEAVVWEAYVDSTSISIYKQISINLKTPAYHTVDVTQTIPVFFELVRTEDGEKSAPIPFELLPIGLSTDASKRKRNSLTSSSEILDLVMRNRCACILRPVLRPDCPIHGLRRPEEEDNGGIERNDLQQFSVAHMNRGHVYMNTAVNGGKSCELDEEEVKDCRVATTTTINHCPQTPQAFITEPLIKSLKKNANSSEIMPRVDSEEIDAMIDMHSESLFKNYNLPELVDGIIAALNGTSSL